MLLALGIVGCDEDVAVPPDSGVDGGALDAGRPDGGGVEAGREAGIGSDAAMDATISGDSGSILPPIDAGNPFGDAGTLGEPAWVPIAVQINGAACDPLASCGGDVAGTWDVTGGCVEVPTPEGLARCLGAMITRGEGRARGRVTFDENEPGTGVARRVAQYEVQVEVFVPSFCAAVLGGCSGVERAVQMAAPDSRCVETATLDCVCAVRQIDVIDDTDFYRTEGGQIISTTTDRRWNYCVEGDTLRYEDAGDTEPGIISLGRR